jgi:hypothetical protein
VHELRPSRVRVSAVEYKGHLIEAFEDQPGRWFAYFRRLDGQNITGTESNSLRTPSASLNTQHDPCRASALALHTGDDSNGLVGAPQPIDALFELGDPLLALWQPASG